MSLASRQIALLIWQHMLRVKLEAPQFEENRSSEAARFPPAEHAPDRGAPREEP